uniref:Pheophorbide a oxygenase domain-containing protein n=2 Tax=Grammatophora oceanica TaxID=210454 RepID=A0A7S1YM73_9STRA
MYHFRRRNESGVYQTQLNIHCVPVKAGRSRVIYSTEFLKMLPEWVRHLGSNRFLNTDAWLHDAERKARSISKSNLRYVYASESDTGVQAYRRWWNKHGHSTAPPHTFGPAAYSDLEKVSRRDYLDPWEWHAKRCSVCRKALKRMKLAQSCGLGFALVGTVLLRRRPIFAAIVAGVGFYVRHMARLFATSIEGTNYPSEIADRSPAHQEDYEKMKIYSRFASKRRP